MKVLHVVDSLSRNGGGVAQAARSLTRALATAGLDVEAHGLADPFTGDDLQSWDPVPVRIHSASGPRSLGFSRDLRRALVDSGADLLHVHAIWQGQSAAVHRAHRSRGLPYLVTPHGMLDPVALAFSPWKKRLASLAYEAAHLRDAAALHALTESEFAAIRAHGLAQPVCLVPNGVDLPDPGETGPAAGPKVLLYLGRLHPKKGLVPALRAWARFRERGDWKLVVAGWDQGGHAAELRRLCSELGLAPPAVDFVGPVFGEAKEALWRSAEAFFLPSSSEGLPMAVLEAWAHRMPVLMTPACNLPEGFAAGAALDLGSDEDSMERGLRTLAEMSESQRRSMGEAGRRLVEAKFTWPRVAGQLVEAYRWIAGGGERPDFVR